jgi:16S rRNA G966 N2-methylase RsmD
MDPPYADPAIERTIGLVAEVRMGRPGSLLIVGHSPRVTLADSYPGLTRIKYRRLGDSCFSIYEHDSPAMSPASGADAEEAA